MPTFRTILTCAMSAAIVGSLSVAALRTERPTRSVASAPVLAGKLPSDPITTGSISGKGDAGAPYRKQTDALHRRDLASPAKADGTSTWRDPPRR